MTTWKKELRDFLVSISEKTGLHPLDFIAIILLPIVYLSAKKYFQKEKKITLADKIYDLTLFTGAIFIYIIVFLRFFGVINYD